MTQTNITLDMIEDAKRAEEAARDVYDAARKEHRRLKVQRLSDLYGLVIGETRVRNTKRDLLGVVIAIEHSFGVDSKPWIRVKVLRKDGEPGAMRNWFANWEIVP